ncbi:hypothetical protein C1884_00125 [Pseudomonas sp. GW460-R15]|nr:hypothetical protein C1887_23335 [Pseudomonas sp. GW456-R21]POA71553.1 hypothetical protein C1884_00125 [Pseudomonas sp. GW460-R15]
MKVHKLKLHLLLALHPDAERKIGVGVEHFRIERNELAGVGCDWCVMTALKTASPTNDASLA